MRPLTTCIRPLPRLQPIHTPLQPLLAPRWDSSRWPATTQHQRRGILTLQVLRTTFSDPGSISIVPAQAMLSLHEVGLPWLVALPVSALLLRTIFLYPWFIRDLRRDEARLGALQPLIDARMSHAVLDEQLRHQQQRLRAGPGASARNAIKPESLPEWALQLRDSYRKRKMRADITRRLQREYGSKGWHWLSAKLIPFAVLLVVSEGVRRLCGYQQGLLVMLLGPVQGWFEGSLQSFSSIWSARFDEVGSSGLDEDVSVAQKSPTSLPAQLLQHISWQANPRSWFQDSLKTAGLPWCEDLTQPDETWVLPGLFTATLMTSLIWRSSAQSTSDEPKAAKNPFMMVYDMVAQAGGFQKALIFVSPLALYPATQMPVAMLVYFMSNLVIGRAQSLYVVRKFPLVRGPRPCRTRASIIRPRESVEWGAPEKVKKPGPSKSAQRRGQ